MIWNVGLWIKFLNNLSWRHVLIKIVKIEINRYRSIMRVNINLEEDDNIVTICGKNNVGKTNTLRAINLFFHPNEYEPHVDMPMFKIATGGAAVYPKIVLTFLESSKNEYYEIERNWQKWNNDNSVSLRGTKYLLEQKRKTTLNENECNKFLQRIKFYYIEAVNLIIPEVIEEISEEMITNEFLGSRFSKSKKELKDAYDQYVDGLQKILDEFANSISETFKEFRNNWDVKFIVPRKPESVRDLISEDVQLTIDDKGTLGVDGKGSGLQRLATILLQFESSSRRKKGDTTIFCIDEPDIFLHEGLQKKLKEFFDKKSNESQIIYTTHSKNFIDTFNMKNIILLDATLEKQHSVRKKKDINIVKTHIVDLNNETGYDLICENLGIEKVEYNVLDRRNLIVEGNCDKKYIEKLMLYFNIIPPKIISANGVDNIIKYLEFYESYYKDVDTYLPKVTVVYDNDSTGREKFEKNIKKQFPHIDVKHYLLTNYLGNSSTDLSKNHTNNEIEDFMYPEVICYLVNEILKKKNMNSLNTKDLMIQLSSKSFQKSGILNLCEFHKNNSNPNKGEDISFVNSGNSISQLKESLAGVFELEGNRKLLKILEEANKKYPVVRETLLKLASMLE